MTGRPKRRTYALIVLTPLAIGLPIVAVFLWRPGLEAAASIVLGVWIVTVLLVRAVLRKDTNTLTVRRSRERVGQGTEPLEARIEPVRTEWYLDFTRGYGGRRP